MKRESSRARASLAARVASIVACAGLVASCTLVRSLDYLGAGGPLDAGGDEADAPSGDDVSLSPDAADATSEGDAPACAACGARCTCGDCGKAAFGATCGADGDCATGACDTGTSTCTCGANMVAVDKQGGGGTYCVDATEVVNDDYQAFLDAKVDPSTQGCACAWNASFQPAAALGPGDHPVTNVDFCDAVAFCVWKGKHLCGAIGGTALAYEGTDYERAAASEWYNACSHGDTVPYPYGGGYDPNACNGADHGVGDTWGVGTQSCQGGVDGLWDMSGDVAEWENDCEARTDVAPQRVLCRVRGGSYQEASDGLRCDSSGMSRAYSRDDAHPYVGLRCCAG